MHAGIDRQRIWPRLFSRGRAATGPSGQPAIEPGVTTMPSHTAVTCLFIALPRAAWDCCTGAPPASP
ncbi:MAG: hypothetical protein MZU91_08515 [Desulfosudis oleivorans]|nr:hypothetical protein [Desulfosudis oleivorans]